MHIKVKILPIHIVQSCYHWWHVSLGLKHYSFYTKMPIHITSMKLLYDRHPRLQPTVPIPNHKHLTRKYLQVIIGKKFTFEFIINLRPLRWPFRQHTRGHVIGMPMLILQCHIKETTLLHVAILHKMSCKVRDVVLEERSHHRKRHQVAEGDEETTLLFWLPF